jgi:ribosomal-protein-alanine N-acetyltransferase
MTDVLRIENASFEHAWTGDNFKSCLGQCNAIGVIAEYNYQVIGFMIYELHKGTIHLINIAVDPEFRRHGIGSQMVRSVINKLPQQKREAIILSVRESNLSAQLFFKRIGFHAVGVDRKFFEDVNEDAYNFRFQLERPEFASTNRISKYIEDEV